MLHVRCPGCSAKYKIAERLLGSSIACGKCGEVFSPSAEDAIPEASAPSAPSGARPARAAGGGADRQGPATPPGHAPAARKPPRHAGSPPRPAAVRPRRDEPSDGEADGGPEGEAVPLRGARRRPPAGGPRSHPAPGGHPHPRLHPDRGSRLHAHEHVPGDRGHHATRPKPRLPVPPAVAAAIGGGILLCVVVLLVLSSGRTPEVPVAAPEPASTGPAPAIRVLQPERMNAEGVERGAKVTIIGSGLREGEGFKVLFGSYASPAARFLPDVSPAGERRVEVEVPPGKVGEVPVKVVNPDGQESNFLSFHYTGDVRLTFNPDTDLPGYRTSTMDPFAKWIIDLAPFESRRKETITSSQLDEIRKRWKETQEKLEAETAAIQKDPRLEAAYARAVRLSTRDEYFKKVDFLIAIDLPFVFYIQRPPKDDPAYKQEIVSKFEPLLRKLRDDFEEEFVRGLGLKRSLDPEIYCIAVLATRGNYVNDYAVTQGMGQGGLQFAGAHYNSQGRLAVTFEDEFNPLNQDQARRGAILHEFVHALQHMYCACGDAMPKPTWYAEGLAELLSAEAGRVPRDRISRLAQILRSDKREIFISSLEDLVAAPGYGEVIMRAALRARQKGVQVGPDKVQEFQGGALDAFYAQASATVYFLHEGQDGKYRRQFLEYMKAAQTGASGWEPFSKAFEGVDPRQLEREVFEFALK